MADSRRSVASLVVGRDVPRTDAVPKVTGAAQYVADMQHPGMLHAAVLRSPHPHARIVSHRHERRGAMPGVKAVVIGEDTAQAQMGRVPARSLSARDRQGALRRR